MGFLDNCIKKFETISLKEMDSVALMKRVDTKFLINKNLLESIFPSLSSHYKILKINGVTQSRYNSFYFDTINYNFFLNHHNGKLNRFKVRFREYIDSEISFLEVKKKNQSGKTIKKRIKVDRPSEKLNTDQKKYINEIINKKQELIYCHTNNFFRLTLVNKYLKERITLDFDLQFIKDDKIISEKTNNVVIIELKQESLNRNSFFYKLLKENGVRPSSMSKYCIGTSLLNSNLKANRFKKNFRILNKINNN